MGPIREDLISIVKSMPGVRLKPQNEARDKNTFDLSASPLGSKDITLVTVSFDTAVHENAAAMLAALHNKHRNWIFGASILPLDLADTSLPQQGLYRPNTPIDHGQGPKLRASALRVVVTSKR